MNDRDPNGQVSIRLPLGAWEVLVQLLKKSGPWETVDPLIQALRQQMSGAVVEADERTEQ